MKDGHLDKKSKHNQLISISELPHAILVPLVLKADKSYQIDRDLIKAMDDYKTQMGKVFNYLNNIKEYRSHNHRID